MTKESERIYRSSHGIITHYTNNGELKHGN